MTETTGRVGDAENTEDLEPSGRLRSTAEALGGFIRRVPFSIAVAVLLVVTALVTGTFFGAASDETATTWAAGVITTVDGRQWWTVATALVIPFDPFQLVFGVLAALVLLGVAERRMGTWRTIVAFLVTGAIGVAVGTLLQWVGSLAGEWWATGTAADLTLDPLTGIVGALMTATAFMGRLWRRRIRVVTIAFILVFVLYDGDSSNAYRLVAAIAGYLLGAVLTRDASTLSAKRSSHRETRTLVAAVVAVTAVGPIVALVNRSELTPFAFGSYLFADEPLELAAVMATCGGEAATAAAAASESCTAQLALLSAQGFGMFLLSFVPVLLLLVAAWGLRHGRRFARWLAIAVNAAILLFARTAYDVTVTTADVDDGTWTVFDLGELVVWAVAVLALPIGIIVMLVVTRRHFQIRAPREAFARFAVVVVGTFVVLAGAYLVAGLATVGEYWPAATGWDVLLDTFKRFVPPHFLAVVDPIVLPGHDVTSFLAQAVGPVFWAVFIAASIRLMSRTGSAAKTADDARLRELLHRNGGGTLGFMATWPGNVAWFSDDGDSAVAYRVINGVAITMSDPICAAGNRGRVIREFAAFCDANSWVPVFYSVHPQYLPVFDELGWQHMSVGEETLVRTTGLELAGKPWQKVRQALNRGIKEGMTTVWTSWDELPLATLAEIEAISEEWVAEKELPEMGFTLGGIEELKDPEVRLMLAVGPDGRLQAVTSWLPVHRDGSVIGWTIDFMRRADGSMNGIMEFLIASAALHMKDTGAEVLSLSGAPLATKPLEPGETPPEPTVMTRLLDFLASTLEPAYGFSSLFRFKAKFNPDYETISMAYPDPLALPTIGLAIGKAYLPEVSPAEAVALVKTLTK
ncbi:rhomboid family intramembrane serine protease [Agromyces fucosus]|uniref:Rhomboid family intramembrane serine protease n=1 Tax=Agromyces fucosus TaxID=41985 RepID=A0A4Q2JT07_9MICO|nr:rhomboid family intramembrane serine protease [Agromyces fucosus]RXZ49248.1 rhomboid family intramembrane serine protease [Agromyces fucosus]